MKVLLINNCHYSRGGADIVYLNTGKLLKKYGHEVKFFSTQDSNNENTDDSFFTDGVDFLNSSLLKKVALIPRFLFSFKVKTDLGKVLKTYKPDLAHIHLYKGNLTSSILIALKNANIPSILSVHDYGLLCPHNLFLDGRNNICTICLNGSPLNCILNKCNRNNLALSCISALEYTFHSMIAPFNSSFTSIVAVSKFSQNLHNSSNRISNKLLHLYNFYPNLEDTIPNKSKGNYFLFFGRLSKEKGVKTLIKAWETADLSSKLKIVGTGEQYSYLSSQHNKNIEFLGFKTGQELRNLIKNASFIVVPSEWYENNPLTIIEAYANGKPVIGANIGGITELIVDKKTGFLFKMGDVKELSEKLKIAEMVDGKTYLKLSEQARLFADHNFSERSHYKSLINLYYNTIEKFNYDKRQF